MISNQIFVDTSWFKALSDPKDGFYTLAKDQFLRLKKENRGLISTNFVLDETFTLMRVKVDLKSALDFKEALISMGDILKIVRVIERDEIDAWGWFPRNWSKLSFTDCTSFAVMKRLDLKEVAAFDEHFAKAGFKTLS